MGKPCGGAGMGRSGGGEVPLRGGGSESRVGGTGVLPILGTQNQPPSAAATIIVWSALPSCCSYALTTAV